MQILVDRGKCQGYGNCVVAEPRVFDLDEDGIVKVLDDAPADELRDQVKYAVLDCPARALDLEG
ncbi:ferredoxin [Streptomyces hebeiensis]|uniref:Ferredoxin n=1 Tax=Streptomyces hebeiensis TaxID=229486 RepID=A0ABP4FA62_9ACTN